MNDSVRGIPADVAQPIRAGERIATLDVLRGFALFGIMFVNVYAFVHPADWFGVDWEKLSAAEYGAEVFKLAFTQGKFYSLFAFLFGLGFTVQLAGAERRGNRFAGRFLWRLTILYVIALVHFVFIWDGDILNTYAASGVLLLLVYALKRALDLMLSRFGDRAVKVSRKAMLVTAFIVIFLPFVGWAGQIYYTERLVAQYSQGVELAPVQQQMVDSYLEMRSDDTKAEHQQDVYDTHQLFAEGSYWALVQYRLSKLHQRLSPSPFWLTVLGLFLVGAYFGRNRLIAQAVELKSGFVKLGLVALAAGIVGNVGFVYANLARPSDPALWWMWLTYFSKTVSGLAFALFYVAGITLLMLGPMRRLLGILAPVGQMALTNYLLQSLIGAWVFYGYGLGLMGQLNVFEQFAYMLVLFGAQVIFSRWWLARFRFGPMEWLWRSATYTRLQPMRHRLEQPGHASGTFG